MSSALLEEAPRCRPILASTKMLSAAARGNCGKLEKWTAGKALPGSYQTQLKLLSLRRGNHQAPLRRRNGANSRRGAPFHTTPSRRQPRVVSRSSMYSLLRGRLDDPRKIRCDLLGGTCGFNNSTCFSPIRILVIKLLVGWRIITKGPFSLISP